MSESQTSSKLLQILQNQSLFHELPHKLRKKSNGE